MKKYLICLILLMTPLSICFSEAAAEIAEEEVLAEVKLADSQDTKEAGETSEEVEDFIESLDYSAIKEISNGKTEICIESNVAKTQVFLNGVFYGKSSLLVEDLLPGIYVLKVSKPGYKQSFFQIEVKRNYRLTYRVKLEKL